MRNYSLWATVVLFTFMLCGSTVMGQPTRQIMDSLLQQTGSANPNDSDRVATVQHAALAMRHFNLDSALLLGYEGLEQARIFDDGHLIAYGNEVVGYLWMRKREIDSCRHYCSIALQMYEVQNNQRRIRDCLLDIARAEVGLGSLENAEAHLQRAIVLAAQEDDPYCEALSYDQLATISWTQNDLNKAIQYQERAAIAAKRQSNIGLEYHIRGKLADLYHEGGQPDQSIAVMHALIDTMEQQGFPVGPYYSILGNNYARAGKYVAASTCLRKSLDEKKALNDTVGMAVAAQSLGIFYKDHLHKPGLAAAYFSRSIELFRLLNDHEKITSLVHLGHCNIQQENIEEAKIIAQQAEALARGLERADVQSAINHLLGSIEVEQGNPVAGLGLLRGVASEFKGSGEELGWADVLHAMSKAHLLNNQPDSALILLKQAKAVYTNAKRPGHLCNVLRDMATVHRALTDETAALWAENRAHQITDSLEEVSQVIEVLAQEVRGQIAQRNLEQQIAADSLTIKTLELAEQRAMLAWESTLRYTLIGGFAVLILLGWLLISRSRIKRENRLARQLDSMKLKALRSQMNPHFTFNSMNSIRHYISQHDEESAQDYLGKFGRLMRLTLQHSDVDQITIGEELEAVQLYLELEAIRFEEPFDFDIKVDDGLDTSFDSMPPMLLQPYLENAIWHGLAQIKDRQRHLSVHMKPDGAFLFCEITDNGLGRKQAAQLQMPRSADHKSMGMAITKERLDIINASRKHAVSQTINDLIDDAGEPAGTQVVLRISLG